MPLSSHSYLDASVAGFHIDSGLKSMRKVCVISYILKCIFHAIMNPYLLPVSKDFKVEMAPVCSLASSEVSCLQAEGDMEYKNLWKEFRTFLLLLLLASFFHLLRRFRTRPTHP